MYVIDNLLVNIFLATINGLTGSLLSMFFPYERDNSVIMERGLLGGFCSAAAPLLQTENPTGTVVFQQTFRTICLRGLLLVGLGSQTLRQPGQ